MTKKSLAGKPTYMLPKSDGKDKRARPSKYFPHQGEREIARRKEKGL